MRGERTIHARTNIDSNFIFKSHSSWYNKLEDLEYTGSTKGLLFLEVYNVNNLQNSSQNITSMKQGQ